MCSFVLFLAVVIRRAEIGHDWSWKWLVFIHTHTHRFNQLVVCCYFYMKVIACMVRWPGSVRWDRRRGGGEVSDMSGCPACRGTRHARQLLSRLLPQMPPHVGRGITTLLQNDPNQLQYLLKTVTF